MRREKTGEGRGKSDPSKRNMTLREELIDLPLFHTPDIGVSGIVDVIVIPKDEAIRFHDSEHLGGNLLFHAGV